ncbi:MAG TPA: YcxB family protein, partial [Sphingomonadaceae bacterium]|nr:YcxB family protein [Sphingomonadaceae bacterium]
FKGATNFSWDAGGIQLVGPKGESRLDWSDYYRWAEDERLVLLFQSRILYNMIPKSALSRGQLDEIRGHLEFAGVRKY